MILTTLLDIFNKYYYSYIFITNIFITNIFISNIVKKILYFISLNRPQKMEGDNKINTSKTIEQEELKKQESNLESKGEMVYLRVYDMSKGMARILSKQIVGFQVDGVWHTSIETYGNEYFFHGGLVVQKAGTTMFNPCVDRVLLGSTNCSKEVLEDFFISCESTWNEKTYDFFDNNCNNFTNWLANFLVGKDIPNYILELPKKVKNCENFRRFFGI